MVKATKAQKAGGKATRMTVTAGASVVGGYGSSGGVCSGDTLRPRPARGRKVVVELVRESVVRTIGKYYRNRHGRLSVQCADESSFLITALPIV